MLDGFLVLFLLQDIYGAGVFCFRPNPYRGNSVNMNDKNKAITQFQIILTIPWSLAKVVGPIEFDDNNKCRQITGNFDHYADAICCVLFIQLQINTLSTYPMCAVRLTFHQHQQHVTMVLPPHCPNSCHNMKRTQKASQKKNCGQLRSVCVSSTQGLKNDFESLGAIILPQIVSKSWVLAQIVELP